MWKCGKLPDWKCALPSTFPQCNLDFLPRVKAGVGVGLHKTGCGLAHLFAPAVCSPLYQVVFFQYYYREIKGDFMEKVLYAILDHWIGVMGTVLLSCPGPAPVGALWGLCLIQASSRPHLLLHHRLLHGCSMWCPWLQRDSLHTIGHSWGAGSLCSIPGTPPALQHLPWWLQRCLSHILSLLSPSCFAVVFTHS